MPVVPSEVQPWELNQSAFTECKDLNVHRFLTYDFGLSGVVGQPSKNERLC